MKKFIISAIAVMMVAFTANAQVWVGGSINYANEKSTFKAGDTKVTEKSGVFTIAPEVGYNLDENWAVAASLGLTFPKNAANITFSPYARYTFYREGIVSLFGDGGLVFNCKKVKDADADWSYGIFVSPGIAVALNDQFSLVTRLGGISYGWDTERDENSRYTESNFNVGLDLLIPSVGLYYSF